MGLGDVNILSFLLLGCLVLGFVMVKRRWRKSKNKLPPGPWALPIIGHLHLLKATMVHEKFSELARIHGPLMSLRLGSSFSIVASTPEMAKAVLQTHDKVFASRPRTAAGTHIMFAQTDIGFAPYGPYWKLLRQLCLKDVFSKKRMESFGPIRAQEVGALLKAILPLVGTQFLLRPKLLAATNNIIWRMTIGQRFSDRDPLSHELVHLIGEAARLMSLFHIGDYLPFLHDLDIQGYVKRMKAYQKRVHPALQRLLNLRRNEKRECPSDFLDVLLSTSSLTDDNIKAILMDMFTGGTDTSVATMEWAMGEVLANPTVMQMLLKELDSVVGEQHLVQESDIPHLPYLQATVKETMRLHPFLPMLMPHESTKACKIEGYQIPTKTRAYVNVWAIGRDPRIWGPDPLCFVPERFLKSGVELRGHHFELLPFGSGRRGCPGAALGLLNVHFMLASLLHSFHWSSSSPPNLLARPGSVALVMASPLSAIPSLRAPLLNHLP